MELPELSAGRKVGIAVSAAIMVLVLLFAVAAQPVGYNATMGQPVGLNPVLDPLVSHAPTVHVDTIQVYVYNAKGDLLSSSITHNTLTYTGEDSVKVFLGQGTGTAWAKLMVFNDSAYTPAATDSICDPATQAKVENSYGIGPQAGTYLSTGVGTWNMSATFTLSSTPGSAQVLYGACLTTTTTIAGPTNLAAAGTFTSTATLTASGDYCKVVWMLTAS